MSIPKPIRESLPLSLLASIGHWLLLLGMLAKAVSAESETAGTELSFGPLVQEFRLTLDAGRRTEILGPLVFDEERATTISYGVPPLFSWTADPDVDSREFDLLYPLLTYDRNGPEYRWQLFQLLSLSGGESLSGPTKDRFTVFPFYFQQRSPDSNHNYTAVFPFWGHMTNRVLRDEIRFLAFPLYGQTRKRDVVTDNYLYPFFHLRRGDGLEGWQFWPLVGHEHKAVTTRTNGFSEIEVIGGHEKFFALWPIYLSSTTGLGTENPQRDFAVLPLFGRTRSPLRDSTTVLWPFFTATDDRARKYREWDLPWPLIVFARPTGVPADRPLEFKRGPSRYFGQGDGKTVNRVFPLFGQAYTETLHNEFYLWPLYLGRHINAPPFARDRHRILMFLYSDLTERNLDTGKHLRRIDFWPLFTHRVDYEGRERLQVLSLLEPLLPGNKSIERNYSPLWSIWRSEKNPATGARSESLLWNLYRRERTSEGKKCSLLFGLFQYQNTPTGSRWRLFYIPAGRTERGAPAQTKP